MRYAVGLFNDVIKDSHFYEVLRNPKDAIGNEFPFTKTFDWLNKESHELDPIPKENFGREKNLADGKEGTYIGASGGANDRSVGERENSDGDGGAALVANDERAPPKAVERKRPMGVKASKAAEESKERIGERKYRFAERFGIMDEMFC
ncbi:hypothetical protein FGB62_26g25 [Gracilaria domingensis]|nr:hypothetical protein FGB62_26g25 [Gracilaria domingensis]